MVMKVQKIIKPKHCFYILSSIFLFVFVCQLILQKTKYAYQLFFFDKGDTFMDFYNIISVMATGHPYSSALFIYPPFIGLIMKSFQKMLPGEVLGNIRLVDPSSINATRQIALQIRSSQFGMIILFFFLVIGLGAMAYFLSTIKKGSNNEKWLFILLTVFSAPMLFEIERANTIIYALVFILGFLAFKDSKNPWLREISLIFLTCAAGVKVYPALFGLLLIRERRWLDALKTVLYGIIIMFVPFVFFGGFSIIPKLFATLNAGNGIAFSTGVGFKVDLINVFRMIGLAFHFKDSVVISLAGKSSYFLILLAIPAILSIRKTWKAVTILCCMIIVTPAFNYYYALIYIIPAVLLFLDEEKTNKWDYLYAAIFSLMYCPAYFGIVKWFIPLGQYPESTVNMIQNIACVVLYIFFIIEGYFNLYSIVVGKYHMIKHNHLNIELNK